MTLTTQREFHVAIERGEDGYYVASVLELPGCHTQAKNRRELDKRIREVVELYLEEEGKNLHVPELIAFKKIKV
jgi:predicted RNase H-like HicB family nuclease